MFNFRDLRLFVAFLATSALAQDTSSEESEAQSTGARLLPGHPSLTVPPFSPCSLVTHALSQTPSSSASHTTMPPQTGTSTSSPQYGSPRRCSQTIPRARPYGPTSRTAYQRTFSPGVIFTTVPSIRRTIAWQTRTAVSCYAQSEDHIARAPWRAPTELFLLPKTLA